MKSAFSDITYVIAFTCVTFESFELANFHKKTTIFTKNLESPETPFFQYKVN